MGEESETDKNNQTSEENKEKMVKNFNNEESEMEDSLSRPRVEVKAIQIVEDSEHNYNSPKRQNQSLSSFFSRFSPKSPDFLENYQPQRKKIKLEKIRPPIPRTPTKTEDKDTVISSPIGFFKIDEYVNSPTRKVLTEQSNRQVDI